MNIPKGFIFEFASFVCLLNSGFNDNATGKYEIRLKGPKIHLIGKYSVKGSVLFLLITGDGISNITICKCMSNIEEIFQIKNISNKKHFKEKSFNIFGSNLTKQKSKIPIFKGIQIEFKFFETNVFTFLVDPDFLIRFKGNSITKNDDTYLQPEKVKLSFTISQMFVHLDNLYNGNKLLGDYTNAFLNRNWLEVWTEIRKSVFTSFGQIVGNVLVNFFSTVPYEDLFAAEQ